MTVRRRREERLMRKLVGTGSKSGASPLSRVGDVCSQPRVWAAFAAALSLSGPRGEVVPFAVELRGGDPISEWLRA